MTVLELIAELTKYPDDTEVLIVERNWEDTRKIYEVTTDYNNEYGEDIVQIVIYMLYMARLTILPVLPILPILTIQPMQHPVKDEQMR